MKNIIKVSCACALGLITPLISKGTDEIKVLVGTKLGEPQFSDSKRIDNRINVTRFTFLKFTGIEFVNNAFQGIRERAPLGHKIELKFLSCPMGIDKMVHNDSVSTIIIEAIQKEQTEKILRYCKNLTTILGEKNMTVKYSDLNKTPIQISLLEKRKKRKFFTPTSQADGEFQSPYETQLQAGAELFHKKNYSSALLAYEIAKHFVAHAEKHRKHLAWKYKAACYENLGQYENAINEYNDAHKQNANPKDGTCMFRIAICYHRLEKYEKALKSTERLIGKGLDHLRGLSNDHMENFDKAIVHYNKAIQHDLNNWNNYYRRGRCHMYSKKTPDYNAAIKDFKKAIEGATESAQIQAHLYIAQCYAALSNYYFAIKTCEIILEKNPQHEKAKNLMAEIHFNSGKQSFYGKDYELASSSFQKAINLNPSYTEDIAIYHSYIGFQYYEGKKYKLAIAQFVLALKYNPCFKYFYMLGECFRKLENYERAAKCLKKASELDPKSTTTLISLASCYTEMGNPNAAMEIYEQLIQSKPNCTAAHVAYGLHRYLQDANYKYAIEDFKKAMNLDLQNPNTHFMLWLCYKALHKEELGLEYLKNAQTLDPENKIFKKDINF